MRSKKKSRKTSLHHALAASYPTALAGSIYFVILGLLLAKIGDLTIDALSYIISVLIYGLISIPFLLLYSALIGTPLIHYLSRYPRNRLFLFTASGAAVGILFFITATVLLLREQIENFFRGIMPSFEEIGFWLLIGSPLIFYPACIGFFASFYMDKSKQRTSGDSKPPLNG